MKELILIRQEFEAILKSINGSTELSMVEIPQTLTKPYLARIFIKSKLS